MNVQELGLKLCTKFISVVGIGTINSHISLLIVTRRYQTYAKAENMFRDKNSFGTETDLRDR